MFGPEHNEMLWAKVRQQQNSTGQHSGDDTIDHHEKNDVGKVYTRRGSSVLAAIKKTRGSNYTSDRQANNVKVINMSARGSRDNKVNTKHSPDKSSGSMCRMLPVRRRLNRISTRRGSGKMTKKQFHSFKNLVQFVQKHNVHSVKLLQIAMTPFKVCSH